MPIPNKALREDQLRLLTVGSAVNDGSHQISRVRFIDHDGVQKAGFLKLLEPTNHYPELLAKMSVAASVFKRIFQGEFSAEERLVFNKDDELIGTLSIGIEGFKPWNFADEQVPGDPVAKEQVVPSTKTLIEKRAMRALFGRWIFDDDDAHPHNLGFTEKGTADIDFDMLFYWFTIYMKEPRPGIGVPKKRISFSINDWESFPVTKDAKPYHWPTYRYPGQETLPTVVASTSGAILPKVLPKTYADPTQFAGLAKDREAQDQKLEAALSFLLTYDPDMMRARLTEQFGDMPLNYTSLDASSTELRIKYETEFPALCNEKTNVEPFVKFMMKLYQDHYDNLYRVVVFHMGCVNNGYGVSLLPTSKSLYLTPSLYKNIREWAIEQNNTLYSKSSKPVQYNLESLHKRYHQVWRDAFAPQLKELLYNAFSLTKELSELSKDDEDETGFVIPDEIIGKKPTDNTVTNVWALFGTMPELSTEKIEPSISVDKKSKVRDALLQMIAFTNTLYSTVKEYYEKDRERLTDRDNETFVQKIEALCREYDLKVRKNLGLTSSYALKFYHIVDGLKKYAETADFDRHLMTTDDYVRNIELMELPHTNEAIIAQFNDSLFVWAASTKPEELSLLIEDIIDKKYKSANPLSTRLRAEPVKAYLAASATERGDNRLAYILSASHEATGALNTLLILHLTPHVLKTHPIGSINKAFKSGAFETDIAVFSAAATDFAKKASRFTHLYNEQGLTLFYKTLFEWIDALPRDAFLGLVKSSITAYEKQLWGTLFGGSSRKVEVLGYCNKYGQAKALALTFINGDDKSSLSDILFHKIIAAIQADVKKNGEKLDVDGYRLIAEYDTTQHKEKYLAELKRHSIEPSHNVSQAVIRSPLSATM
jgi:hypothetical protein